LYLYYLWEFESGGHERETHAMRERERGVELTGGGVAKLVAAPEVGNGWEGFYFFFRPKE